MELLNSEAQFNYQLRFEIRVLLTLLEKNYTREIAKPEFEALLRFFLQNILILRTSIPSADLYSLIYKLNSINIHILKLENAEHFNRIYNLIFKIINGSGLEVVELTNIPQHRSGPRRRKRKSRITEG